MHGRGTARQRPHPSLHPLSSGECAVMLATLLDEDTERRDVHVIQTVIVLKSIRGRKESYLEEYGSSALYVDRALTCHGSAADARRFRSSCRLCDTDYLTPFHPEHLGSHVSICECPRILTTFRDGGWMRSAYGSSL
jgi:hypothetical protein